jgi:hypothetical protein
VKHVFLDIETFPATDPAIVAELTRRSLIGGGSPSEIATRFDKALRKTSLDGTFGTLIVCCVAVDDEPAQSVNLRYLLDLTDSYVTVVGHNVAAFDLPFLQKICLRSRVRYQPPARVCDTMKLWDPVDKKSLDDVCLALGIAKPGGEIAGADVFDLWVRPDEPGRAESLTTGQETVIKKCLGDVDACRQIFLRIKGVDRVADLRQRGDL